jgi:predicted nucleic-acid-binding Zn-ribbon protein
MEKSLNCPKCGDKIRSVGEQENFDVLRDNKFIEERCIKCKDNYAIKARIEYDYYLKIK